MGFWKIGNRFQRLNGRSERIRTSDPLVPNEVRYQAALHSDWKAGLIATVRLPRKARERAIFRKSFATGAGKAGRNRIRTRACMFRPERA